MKTFDGKANFGCGFRLQGEPFRSKYNKELVTSNTMKNEVVISDLVRSNAVMSDLVMKEARTSMLND